ncbi:fatty acid synthase alpha subunit Lsd1, partial [Coemansia sp. RSA 552]
MLRPRAGRTYTVDISGGLPTCLVVTNSAGAIELSLECSADYVIRLIVHHVPTPDTPLTLQLALQYCPSQCTAPIHGSSSQEYMAIQRFFRDTWAAGAGKPFVSVTDTDEVVRSEFTVTNDHSQALCSAIGNSAWQYTYGAKGVLCAPAEFTHASVIEGSLRVMQSSLFGPGQANVVHLSNKLTLEEGAPLIQVGDRLVCTLRIDSLVNHQSGKKLVVHGTIHRNEHKYATVESEFLCRSYFINASQAFERKRGQKTVILLPSEADVPVLEAKEWFVYREDCAARLEPGVLVEFCLDSEYHFKTPDVYSSIVVTGTVTIRQPNCRPVCVADVDFAWNTCSEDPVAKYLRKHKVPVEDYLFEDSGYSLATTARAHLVRMTAPDSNWDYARYSFDSNAFHLNPYIADYANLPGTITHGCWTSASTRSIMERVVAGGHPERIRMYQTNFIDMVLPQDELTTEFTHVGMKQGRMLIRGQTSKVDGGAVMTFTAEVEQPATAYVFTGLGSQEVGMGMDLYQQSPAARAVWDRANAYMLSMYDIDLLKIVRTNPDQLTIRFNGRAGESVRQNFFDLGRGWSGEKSPSLLPEITPKSLSYTFRSKSGLLNLTQLTQPAILMVAMASMADMRAQGLVPTNATFAGHSLGELCAISVFSGALSLEDALDIALYRGLTLQSSVSYDEHGRSQYGMVAVNPSRVSSTFGQASLELVVDKINAACPGLLQVVNYNVDGAQYVAAGTLANLAVLRMVLDELVTMNITVDTDIAACTEQILRNVLATPIDSAAVRGQATVPLLGVEVPSHSSLLADKVPQFREVLRKKLNANTLSLDALCDHYIPNVTA